MKMLRSLLPLIAIAALSPASAHVAATPTAVTQAMLTSSLGASAAAPVPGRRAAPGTRTAVAHRRVAVGRAAQAASSSDGTLAWTLTALIMLLGATTALYPIVFYIRTVWASRQRIIFDTLRWDAKEMYLRLYHRSESGTVALSSPLPPKAAVAAAAAVAQLAGSPDTADAWAVTPAARTDGSVPSRPVNYIAKLISLLFAGNSGDSVDVPATSEPVPAHAVAATVSGSLTPEQLDERERVANARFEEVYNRWFGRGRLIAPALIVSALVVCYVLLAAIAGAGYLLPYAGWPAKLNIGPVVLASMTGAYILVSMDTIERVTRRDLLPDDLNLSALRLAAAVPLGYAFSSLAKDEAAPFIALAITALPLRQVSELLRRLGYQRLGVQVDTEAPTLDAPSRLSGVDRAVCERLSAVGVNTITQLAYSDPVQLTMRTSMNFVFLLDVVSQALAWVYLEAKLDAIRPMGLRGAFEICTLCNECADTASQWHAQALALNEQLPAALGMTREQVDNAFHQIADDDRARFLLYAY